VIIHDGENTYRYLMTIYMDKQGYPQINITPADG
jgi:hypothetical protein